MRTSHNCMPPDCHNSLPIRRLRSYVSLFSRAKAREVVRRVFLSGSFTRLSGINPPHGLPTNAERATSRRFAFSAFLARIYVKSQLSANLSGSWRENKGPSRKGMVPLGLREVPYLSG